MPASSATAPSLVPPAQGQALVDLGPALDVALLGAFVALLCAAGVGWRGRQRGLRGWAALQRVLTVATLFLTLDLVVFGAFTRLTDSGLGCPDWPGCYGETSPWQAHDEISAAHAALPSGPVSPRKAWIEMGHRYLATGVGALITLLTVLAWWGRHQPGALSPWWATATLVWVCAQGAFGAFTVTFKLQPLIVTGHLLGAMLGVALLTAQVRRMAQRTADVPALAMPLGARWRRLGWALMALLGLQLALGGWVSSNYAVLACTEWPMCQGQWWPEMEVGPAFTLWRPLGQDGAGGYLSLPALTAIHMAHRLMAILVVVALLAYGLALRRQQVARREAGWLCGLVALQVLTGLSNVVLGWPLAAALLHTLGAALMVACLTRILVPAPALIASAHQGGRAPRQGAPWHKVART